jgi:hypothetical protein
MLKKILHGKKLKNQKSWKKEKVTGKTTKYF